MGDGSVERGGDSERGGLPVAEKKADETKPQFHEKYLPVSDGSSFGIETPANSIASPGKLNGKGAEESVGGDPVGIKRLGGVANPANKRLGESGGFQRRT